MSLMMIYVVLSEFGFVAKLTGGNLNKYFTNRVWGRGGQPFVKFLPSENSLFWFNWLQRMVRIYEGWRFEQLAAKVALHDH